MKVLLDTCMSANARTALQSAGHDVIWGGDWQADPGDSAILTMAHQQGRVLVTLDKDFGDLAVRRRAVHCGILRLARFRAKDQAAVCLRVLEGHAAVLSRGAVITAEPGKLRIRQPLA